MTEGETRFDPNYRPIPFEKMPSRRSIRLRRGLTGFGFGLGKQVKTMVEE